MSFKLNPSENYIYNNENVVYIGKSNNMKNRINQHNSVKDAGLVNFNTEIEV